MVFRSGGRHADMTDTLKTIPLNPTNLAAPIFVLAIKFLTIDDESIPSSSTHMHPRTEIIPHVRICPSAWISMSHVS
jgi:hypothetical protein